MRSKTNSESSLPFSTVSEIGRSVEPAVDTTSVSLSPSSLYTPSCFLPSSGPFLMSKSIVLGDFEQLAVPLPDGWVYGMVPIDQASLDELLDLR
jgi:hypothetical protein